MRIPKRAGGLLLVAALTLAVAQPVLAQSAATPAIGTRLSVSLEELPPPHATPATTASPRIVPRPEALLPKVPEGFSVNVFADGFTYPRWMTVAANGDVLLALPRSGEVALLRDTDGDGRAEMVATLVDGLSRPHGLLIREGWLYIGQPGTVFRVPYEPGDTRIATRPERVAAEGALRDSGGHWTRNFALHPDGRRLYVSVGSHSNVKPEWPPRATIQEFTFDAEGRLENQRIFAAGLRNPVGIAFYPGTEDLYTTVNERDALGDELVPDYLTRVRDGEFFGWPFVYLSPDNPQPGLEGKRPDLVERTVTPDLLFRAHSAPLGLVFYDSSQFPEAWRGDAFVALHGSWNASTPRGYYVARVPFENGRPAGWYEPFVIGFRLDDGSSPARVWGRPAGLAVAADGALLIADDASGTVWRVSYTGAE
jgi:glucose/arabinose dehydrogenase